MACHSSSEHRSCVDLYVECKNLKDKDVFNRSDPCAIFFVSRKGGRLEEVGRTEIVKNSVNPKFAKPIRVDYYFNEIQLVKIKVFDSDKHDLIPNEDDLLGTVECTLGQIVAGKPFRRTLHDKKGNAGEIIIRVVDLSDASETVTLSIHGKSLEDKDVFGKSDPFLEIKKETVDRKWQLVHRTETIQDNLNPQWKPFTISTQTLCDEDRHKQIKIDCYDHDDDGYHDFIGGFVTNLETMLQPSSAKAGFACINNKKLKKKKNYSNSGIIYISCQLSQSARERALLDYVLGGLQIHFTVGIDFTQSNGDPKDCTSRHHISHSSNNEYMLAIKAIGTICQDYDSDNLFPAFGFGAKLCPSALASHDFPINFNNENPNCVGIDGLLNAYTNCVQKVELFGPTIVTPIINHVIKNALAAQQQEVNKGAHAYHVLLILTDGIFNDVPEAKHAIVRASELPMSIIIVGVGINDYSDMKELTGNGGTVILPSGEMAKRDIVQFVPFLTFKQRSTADLASHVLAKIPKQVTDYYKMRGLQPNRSRGAACHEHVRL